MFLGAAAAASAEVVTTEEPIVLETGETALEVSQVTATPSRRRPERSVKCKKVHGWHGLKHPLFGYFYWKYILTIRWCWEPGRSLIVKTTTPGHPRTGATSNAASSSRGGTSTATRRSASTAASAVASTGSGSQGKFQQCFQFCFSAKTPWVRLTGYPGGAWGFAHGN